MSARVAAGCARSRFQSVSVVPMIQCVSHGMTNSTELAVRRMIAVSLTIRSRGTTMCTPLEARTLKCPRCLDSACTSSVHTPAALITQWARISVTSPFSVSRTRTPSTRSDSRRNPVTWVEVRMTAP